MLERDDNPLELGGNYIFWDKHTCLMGVPLHFYCEDTGYSQNDSLHEKTSRIETTTVVIDSFMAILDDDCWFQPPLETHRSWASSKIERGKRSKQDLNKKGMYGVFAKF